tara:strand:+ start:2917 stop:3084 length:168 start_codon:yes stop_codon:yes gene_type:complete
MRQNYYEFITEYEFNGIKYSDIIIAKSEKEAEEILKSKKQTEFILGYDPTNPIKV